MEELTEQQLLEAARGGDARALEELLARHQAQVYRFGMKMCRDPQDAEDVLQETLLAAARSIGEFRGSSSLSSWLYAIARSFCIKKRRKSKFAPERERSLDLEAAADGEGLAHAGAAPDEAAFGKEIQSALERAIGTLDPDQREVLLLRDVEGLKAVEVAEVLGISVPAVKSRLHRARVRVRELLAPALGMPAPAAAAVAGAGGCPDVLNMYSKHVEGEISAELCAEMEGHVERCQRCRTACDSLKQTLALCSRLPAAHVPVSVQESVRAALHDFLRAPASRWTSAVPSSRK